MKSCVFDKVTKSLPTSVSGKVFAITGTTSGTGFIAATEVAKRGGVVLLLNRASKRFDESVTKLREAVPEGTFVPVTCDLQDFASVREAAKKVTDLGYDKLYCLANNAGITGTHDKATKDGYDVQMQTNHLSHFLLTSLLFPLIKAGAAEHGEARIVAHTSVARYMNKGLEEKYLGKNGGNLGGDSGTYLFGPMADRYSQSKLADSVFVQCLNDKLASTSYGIKAVTAHPGISQTGFYEGDKAVKTNFFVRNIVLPMLNKFSSQSPEDGSTGLLRCMMDPSVNSGKIYGPKGNTGKPVELEPKPTETDEKAKSMLWSASEAATGVTFSI